MAAYPSVNWWPGNLQPYESRLSFLVRFCELNGISARRGLKFLNVAAEGDASPAVDEIARLSSVLQETLSVVQATFSPPVRFVDCGRYAPPPGRRSRHHGIRYCEKCAQHGYHSYLHEAEWLSGCPIHMGDLKTAWAPKHTRPVVVGRMAALKAIMQEHCKSWPHCNDCVPGGERGQMASLEAWAAQASQAAALMSRGEVWCSGEDVILGRLSLAQAFGQLRALAPMPEVIESLLAETGGTWCLQNRLFPLQAKIEIQRLKPLRLSFARIIEFYKCISALSTTPPRFVARLKAVQKSLRARHGACHCAWGLSSGGWELHWVRVHAQKKAYGAVPCPFDVALAELDRGWGHPGLRLLGWKAVHERVLFTALSREMHAAGLMRYTKDAKISPDGNLYIDQDVASCCKWNRDSPLTELLDTACGWEIESAFSALSVWLDDIEQGRRPSQRDDPKYCVCLRETDDGLSLVRWIRNAATDHHGSFGQVRGISGGPNF